MLNTGGSPNSNILSISFCFINLIQQLLSIILNSRSVCTITVFNWKRLIFICFTMGVYDVINWPLIIRRFNNHQWRFNIVQVFCWCLTISFILSFFQAFFYRGRNICGIFWSPNEFLKIQKFNQFILLSKNWCLKCINKHSTVRNSIYFWCFCTLLDIINPIISCYSSCW